MFSRDRGKLLSQLRMVNTLHYEGGEVIFEQGGPVSGCYIICTGKTKESWRTSMGKKHTIKILGQGGLLAFAEVLSNQVWHDTCTIALEDTSAVFIGKEELQNLLRWQELSTELSLRLARETVFLKRELGLKSYYVEERVASLLLTIGKDYGTKDEDGSFIDFKFTNEELAELVGCTPVTVSRTLSKLIKRNLISRNGQRIKILNEQDLKRLSADVIL
ncbi:MAG: Crp/Fnr family transcriptional regulator [Candidatus Bipolaricaulia bacterium]